MYKKLSSVFKIAKFQEKNLGSSIYYEKIIRLINVLENTLVNKKFILYFS